MLRYLPCMWVGGEEGLLGGRLANCVSRYTPHTAGQLRAMEHRKYREDHGRVCVSWSQTARARSLTAAWSGHALASRSSCTTARCPFQLARYRGDWLLAPGMCTRAFEASSSRTNSTSPALHAACRAEAPQAWISMGEGGGEGCGPPCYLPLSVYHT